MLAADDFTERLRTIVREKRQGLGKTQEELSAQINGLQQSAIARVETGRSENIGIKVLFDIASACNMKLSELVALAEGVDEISHPTASPAWNQVNCKVLLLSHSKQAALSEIINNVIKLLGDK